MKALFVSLVCVLSTITFVKGQSDFDRTLPLKETYTLPPLMASSSKNTMPRKVYPFHTKSSNIAIGDTLIIKLDEIDPPVRDLVVEIQLCHGNCFTNVGSSGRKTKGETALTRSLKDIKDNTLRFPITNEVEVTDELDNKRLVDNSTLDYIFVTIKNNTRFSVKYATTITLAKKPAEVGGFVAPQPLIPTIQSAKNHALLISVSNYSDPTLQLKNPNSDVSKLEQELLKDYEFSTITRLTDPTKKELKDTLMALSYKLFRDDNLFIFFAGHGSQSDQGMGIWALQDAKNGDFDSYFSNESLISILKYLNVQHLLVVTDACYGSSLMQQQGYIDQNKDVSLYTELYGQKSRKLMSSSNQAEVPDSNAFIPYFVKKLQANEEEYLAAEELFEAIKLPIHNRTGGKQSPKYGNILSLPTAGNGGFLFKRKTATSPETLVMTSSLATGKQKADNDSLEVPYIKVVYVDKPTTGNTRSVHKGMPETGARITNALRNQVEVLYLNQRGEWKSESLAGAGKQPTIIQFDRPRLDIRVRNGSFDEKSFLLRGNSYQIRLDAATGTVEIKSAFY